MYFDTDLAISLRVCVVVANNHRPTLGILAWDRRALFQNHRHDLLAGATMCETKHYYWIVAREVAIMETSRSDLVVLYASNSVSDFLEAMPSHPRTRRGCMPCTYNNTYVMPCLRNVASRRTIQTKPHVQWLSTCDICGGRPPENHAAVDPHCRHARPDLHAKLVS